jgi:hypothetical protein
MKYGDYVIVTRGPHKSRSSVRVYSTEKTVTWDRKRRRYVERNYVYVELKTGSGVRVGRRDVRYAKGKRCCL